MTGASSGSGGNAEFFSGMKEEYLKSLDRLEGGQLIEGKVVQVDSEHVYVDIGCKSEGWVPRSEFEKDEIPEIGSTVCVVPTGRRGDQDEIIVSKKAAEREQLWKTLTKGLEDHTPVKGRVAKSIKGGFEISLGGGLKAFVPISQMDVIKVHDPEEYVGLESEFYIDRLFSDKKVNIVLSRREWLKENTEKKRDEFFQKISVGDVVKGSIKNFTSFGAFVDLGGFDGLLHASDISWGHVVSPRSFVKKGEEIEVKVIRLDPESKRINLSLKHMRENPWTSFEDRYQLHDVIRGKVTKLMDFGVFIELEEGIEGLAHISQFSWVRRINHPSEVYKVGDEVEAVILGYDINLGKIALGIRQTQENPWDNVEELYPPGVKVKGVVDKVTEAGLFVRLEEGIVGYLHISDYSWAKEVRDLTTVFNLSDEVEVSVIEVDREKRRIRLGMKQLEENPWDLLQRQYPPGTPIEGEVSGKTSFGAFLKILGGAIEGLIRKESFSDNGNQEAEEKLEKLQIGEKIQVYVMGINKERRRLSLSITSPPEGSSGDIMTHYIDSRGADSSSLYTLGSILQREDGEDSSRGES